MTPSRTPVSCDAPQQVTLPPSLMRAITLVTADPHSPPYAGLEAAVLITFGYALFQREDSIDPRQVAVPQQQWDSIAQALLDTPGPSEVARVNLGLDWVNLGPAAGDDTPPATPDTHLLSTVDQRRIPVDPDVVVRWRAAVAAGRTLLGLAAWDAAQNPGQPRGDSRS